MRWLVVVGCAGPLLLAQTTETPLVHAARTGNTALVQELLRGGANPNEGRFRGSPALAMALFQQDRIMFDALVDAGADLKIQGDDHSTALMWSVYGDTGFTGFTERILKAGVDLNAKNDSGATALSLAVRFGNFPAARKLTLAGASYDPLLRNAVRKALSVLQPAGARFLENAGCVSCHHQNLPAMALEAAREHGIPVDESASDYQLRAILSFWQSQRGNLAHAPDPTDSISYGLLGLAALHHPADETVRAMVGYLEQLQRPNGRWNTIARRPPLEGSPVSATAVNLRALGLYGGDPERIARAAAWLARQESRNGEERSMQLLGLAWAGSQEGAIQKFGRDLLARQRPDGGWAQTDVLESDAYATGQALVALRAAGVLAPRDEQYEEGIFFLLGTQFDDGSWRVRSRTIRFQPHVETGFPHGTDQFISAAGTSWASMALSAAVRSVP